MNVQLYESLLGMGDDIKKSSLLNQIFNLAYSIAEVIRGEKYFQN